MNVTKLLRPIFAKRLSQIDRYADYGDIIQQKTLRSLLHQARATEFGEKFKFSDISSYKSFAENVPINDYEALKPYIERTMKGEQNILWPTPIRHFAKSSGTTNDKSKFIPVSAEALRYCHYQGGADCVALYLRENPESRLFSGKGLILGGSRAQNPFGKAYCGDLSAILIQNINPLVNLIRVPSKKIALMSEWDTKLEAIANSTIGNDVTNLSGVPSWFLVLLKHILKKSGKQTISEVWPNLEVFFHGGICFEPYREQYREIIDNPGMHYVETYNASEGFFATQNDLSVPGMLLLIDLGIFYEFIPLGGNNEQALPIWEVEAGKNYEIVITTNGGLWRYRLGDTARIVSTKPLKISISGRTKHYINAFGEELMVDNAERAITRTCAQTGASVLNYTAAPVYMTDHNKGRHQWLIEFGKLPVPVEEFAQKLDQNLQDLNSDYEAKRFKSIALECLEIIPAKKGIFDAWLRDHNKLGGQHKIPRLYNQRDIIEDILQYNDR